MLDDAKALADAGAFAIVLELVTPPVAKEISEAISIPTIGIGSGPDCDGQILVTHDLIGAFPWFTPRFVKPQRELRGGNQVGRGGVEKLIRKILTTFWWCRCWIKEVEQWNWNI